jgi:predicted DNA-binding transcriptional regulator AlpA
MSPDDVYHLPDDEEFLTMKDLVVRTKLHRATIYRLIAADLFPKGRAIGPNSRRWLRRDVREWIVRGVEC